MSVSAQLLPAISLRAPLTHNFEICAPLFLPYVGASGCVFGLFIYTNYLNLLNKKRLNEISLAMFSHKLKPLNSSQLRGAESHCLPHLEDRNLQAIRQRKDKIRITQTIVTSKIINILSLLEIVT